jgi:acyl carrier protein
VAVIELFLLSCRILGRGVENEFLDVICNNLLSAGVNVIIGKFYQTEKNCIVKNFYKNSGFIKKDIHTEEYMVINNVLSIASSIFNYKVNENSKINDFEKWDSLGQLTLFLELESQLGIKFSHEEIINTNVMADIIALVESKQP